MSLLAGRIFFTGLRYHGNNETFLVQNGHITWSYWLRRVREVDLTTPKSEAVPQDKEKASPGMSKPESAQRFLPCRINISLTGLEWFVYNRSAAYDSVLAGIKSSAPGPQQGNQARSAQTQVDRNGEETQDGKASDTALDPINGRLSGQTKEGDLADAGDRSTARLKNPRPKSSATTDSDTTGGNRSCEEQKDSELPFLLELFPIYVECDKAALVMGNENTRGVLIIKTESFSGEIDAAATNTPDPYQQIFNLRFIHPVVEIQDNRDYKEDQATRATRDQEVGLDSTFVTKGLFLRRLRRKFLGRLRELVPYWRRSVESFSVESKSRIGTGETGLPGSSHWQGLSRYLHDQDQDDKTFWASIEYGAVPTIIDSPEASLKIFWDYAGKVKPRPRSDHSPGHEVSPNINGDVPPAWGIDLSIHGGDINYGPWADRHRAELQRVFFPSLCKDALPAQDLPVGADRIATEFRLYVELNESAIIRVPIREDSKNWKYRDQTLDGHPKASQAKRQTRGRSRKSDTTNVTTQKRPYGWLAIKVPADTTVSYSMDMVAGKDGFKNTVDVDIPNVEISSSINHALLWRSGRQRISCDLSAPLKWNAMRSWRFTVVSDDLELFLLREHVFLFIDLVDDWSSGPPSDYLTFVPFRYYLNLQLREVKAYFNVNDANIINNPTDFSNNAYIIISSPLLTAETCIPVDKYRPDKNTIPFDMRCDTGGVSIHVPPWNTQATFVSSKDVGHFENLVVDGRYHYNATTSHSNTDTLVLNVSGQSPTVHLYGFVVRYFLKLKDNYFGDDIHFKTLDEHQELLRLRKDDPHASIPTRPPKKSNDLDVILSVRVDDAKIYLPANLYSSRHQVQIESPSVMADLRFTNYYMDLELAVSPLSLSNGISEKASSPMTAASSTQLFVDGLNIYGHRLFGLPPTEPTYLCNWDIKLGAVTGECTVDFLMALVRGGRAFGFQFDDEENALVSFSSIILHDVTFLRVYVQSIRLWLHLDEAAFLFSTGFLHAKYNDWARSHYSKRANIDIPDIQISCASSESAARHRQKNHHAVETYAYVQTSVHLAIIGRKHGFSKERQLQQELVRREDQRTNRTPFLLLPGLLDDFIPDAVDAPAQSIPGVPLPLVSNHVLDTGSLSSSTVESVPKGKLLRRQSSFLTSRSSDTSILRQNTSFKSGSQRRSAHDEDLDAAERAISGSQLPMYHRESASTRHSAFYSALGDATERKDIQHTSVAFSSQFFAPYFPLEYVQPSRAGIAFLSVEPDDGDFEEFDINLEDIDPDVLSEDSLYSGILVEFPVGLTAVLNPTSLRHIANLVSAFQCLEPEDILDELQVDSVTEIFDMKKKQNAQGTISDLLIKLPKGGIRFLNSSPSGGWNSFQDEQDQYDLTISRLSFASRSETQSPPDGHPGPDASRVSFHLRLGSLGVSAAEGLASMNDTQAAVMASISDVMISMGTKDVTYLDGDIGRIESSTSSGKIEYLASLIHRTNVLATEITELFSDTSSLQKKRIQYFVGQLLNEGRHAPDPPFLIRPSAVLRSASGHIRTFDSWKLATRLRQMWTTLGPNAKDRLRMDCLGDIREQPVPTRRQVAASFEQWRSWDLDNLAESVLLNQIFGTPPSNNGQAEEIPQLGVLRIRQLQLILDPGPKQNELRFSEFTVRGETNHHPEESEGTAESDDEPVPITVVNLYCSDAGISLNWELCELVEDILRLYGNMQKAPKQADDDAVAAQKAKQPRSLHLVVAAGRGSIDVDTVNLNCAFLGDGLKASFLRLDSNSGPANTNLIVSCDAVSSRIRSHSHVLGTFQLLRPSIFFSHESQAVDLVTTHNIKASAGNHEFSLIIKEEPIILMETLDLLIKDEVAQLCRLQQQLQSSPKPAVGPRKVEDRVSKFRVSLATFMDSYNISIPLLQSLTYTVSGVVARVAMKADFGKEMVFDFDIKENSHDMQIRVNNVPRSISLLQIPPTNGRIMSRTGHGEHSVMVSASVELVQLDASAVYSLLSALNRPEISNTINELQDQAKVIKEHITDVFGNDQQNSPYRRSKDGIKDRLVYVVHLTFAGLEVFGNAPLKGERDMLAHISFGLDSVHLEVANRLEQHGPIREYPEVHMNLRQIMFEIQKGTEGLMHSCGNIAFGALVTATSNAAASGGEVHFFKVKTDGFVVNLSPDTVSTVVDVLGYMGDKISDLDTTRELEYLRKLRQSRPRISINDEDAEEKGDIFDTFLSSINYSFEVRDIQISWLVTPWPEARMLSGREDLVLLVRSIEFATKQKSTARLTIDNLQLQMVPPGQDKKTRSQNSALLPEVIFNIGFKSTADARRLAFQAIGKSLDLRLTSGFIIPASSLNDSISLSIKNIQHAAGKWNSPSSTPSRPSDPTSKRTLLGNKRLESMLVDADFAGAVVYLSAKRSGDGTAASSSRSRPSLAGKYGQFNPDESGGSTVLRTPGLACKIEYQDDAKEDPTVFAEVKVDASSNTLYPSVVPLILDITSSVQEVVSETDRPAPGSRSDGKPKIPEEDSILTADPTVVLGRLRLNLGLRICKQEFTLSCQPIARVAATACFEDIYITANTVRSAEQGNFFAISGAFSKLQASVQHVYSRESTGSFEVDSVVLSLMNSKHVSGTSGVSAILKFSPMKVSINAKQLQDFLLFREIWMPGEVRERPTARVTKLVTESSQTHLVQRYQQVAATAAFPWTATISITSLDVAVDLGQAIGKSVFAISGFWISSKKTSDWEQNLCLGFDKVGIDSTGRMSGFMALQKFKLRTWIQWPEREQALNETPMIQASIGFSQFQVKAAFDYQAFLVADITSMDFLMYNVRRSREGSGDRLVAVFDGEAVQVFGTTTSAAQGLALYQAFQRLVQERKASYETSLREIEKFTKRRSLIPASNAPQTSPESPEDRELLAKSPISLDTDVVVTLKALNLGFFPSTFSDHQIFKMEALDAQARFAASIENRQIHSVLGLTLGQLRIGLAGVRYIEAPKAASEISVEDVVQRATGSRGGTILKVPRVEAVMQTWQSPDSNKIDYIFKSSFEGKVEVGWNYSRISYIRGMFANHSKTLAATLGKKVPLTAIRVTGVPGANEAESDQAGDSGSSSGQQQQKITAEVTMPQSKYDYVALEPPIIETPQLRDMGEATPPLEWIGLHRDRLPNLTHQIVIVSLLELAGEVEDAYSRILGSS